MSNSSSSLPNASGKSYQHSDSSRVMEYTTTTSHDNDFDNGSSPMPPWWQTFWQRSAVPTQRRVPSPPKQAPYATTKAQPLLFSSTSSDHDDKAARRAAIFLRDWEHGRAPTLPRGTNVSEQALTVHAWRFSSTWKVVRMAAVLLWFLAAGWEGSNNDIYACWANGAAMLAFLIDMALRHCIGLPPEPLRNVMLGFMVASSVELVYRAAVTVDTARFWITSAGKPVALFYISEKARQAYLSIARIAPIVSRVLALELLLILSFAAVACRLYGAQFESFATLSQSWLSLFQCTYHNV